MKCLRRVLGQHFLPSAFREHAGQTAHVWIEQAQGSPDMPQWPFFPCYVAETTKKDVLKSLTREWRQKGMSLNDFNLYLEKRKISKGRMAVGLWYKEHQM